MKSNLDFARGLALRAEDDLAAAEIGLEHDAPLSGRETVRELRSAVHALLPPEARP